MPSFVDLWLVNSGRFTQRRKCFRTRSHRHCVSWWPCDARTREEGPQKAAGNGVSIGERKNENQICRSFPPSSLCKLSGSGVTVAARRRNSPSLIGREAVRRRNSLCSAISQRRCRSTSTSALAKITRSAVAELNIQVVSSSSSSYSVTTAATPAELSCDSPTA